jgi:hypothetical protein
MGVDDLAVLEANQVAIASRCQAIEDLPKIDLARPGLGSAGGIANLNVSDSGPKSRDRRGQRQS